MLQAWVQMDRDDDNEYTFRGDVACNWADYYHDLGKCAKEEEESKGAELERCWFHQPSDDCRCRACHMRWVQSELNERDECAQKATRCDDAYFAAMRRLIAAYIQRTGERALLQELVATVVPVMPDHFTMDLAFMFVRADCPEGLRWLCEHADLESVGANKFDGPPVDAGASNTSVLLGLIMGLVR